MSKKSIIAIASLTAVLLISGGATWALISSSATHDKVSAPVSPTAYSKQNVQPTPTKSPSPTSTSEPTKSEVPGTNSVSSQPDKAPQQATQEETTIQDMSVREWSDAQGNRYVGPNAISCADGSPPITMGYGMPYQCAYNSDGQNPPTLVE